MGNYTAQYSSADVAEAAIDGLTVFIITVTGIAGIIALVFLYKWGKNQM